MDKNPNKELEKLRLSINDAMRKVHKILNSHDPNKVFEISSKVRFEVKIRILEDENYYYKINVSEEVRPCFLCKIYFTF